MTRQHFSVRPSRQFIGAAAVIFVGSLTVAAWFVVVRDQLPSAVLLASPGLYALWFGLSQNRAATQGIAWKTDGAGLPLLYMTRRVGDLIVEEGWKIERIWLVSERIIFLQLRNNRETQQPKALASDMMHPQVWRRFRVFLIRANYGLRGSVAFRRSDPPAVTQTGQP